MHQVFPFSRPLRLVFGLLVVSALMLGPGTAALAAEAAERAAATEAALDLDALLKRAETENPDVNAARLRWEASRAKAGHAGTLEAPRLEASLMDLGTLGGPNVMVAQTLPGGSKRALLTEAAEHEAAATEADFIQKRLEVARDLQQAFFEYVYQNRALAIHEQRLAQLRNLRKIADSKYAVGSGLQQDPLRAQRELSLELDRRLELEAAIASSRAWLNTLANRPPEAPVSIPKDLPAKPGLLEPKALLARAESHSPALKAARARAEAQKAHLSRAQQNRSVPDFELGVEAGRSMPGDMAYIGAMVGIDLPWFSAGRLAKQVEEAERSLAAAEATYASEKNRLQGEIYRVLAELKRLERQVKLYQQGVMPQARQALQAALAAYPVNKLDFDAVLESQAAVFQAQTDEARARADYHQKLARLEALIGAKARTTAAK